MNESSSDLFSTESRCRVRMMTARGRAAIASVVVSGPNALDIVSAHFHPRNGRPFTDRKERHIVYGEWGRSATTREGVVAVRFGDRIEIHCHGGKQAVDAIIQDVVESGAVRDASIQPLTTNSEVAERNVLDCSIRREAVECLIQTTTQRTALILLDQFNGALRKELLRIYGVVAKLTETTRDSSANRSKRDAELVRDVSQAISRLIKTWRLGSHLVHPFQVVLAGPPNVGKSSLINAMVGYQRSIVLDQPGTTRDVLTASTAIDGWPVELSDTAGLREAGDPTEGEGVTQAIRKLGTADCVLLVFDVTEPYEDERGLRSSYPDSVIVRNKIDLLSEVEQRWDGSYTCAIQQLGISELLDVVARRLVPDPPSEGSAVVFTQRQVDKLQETLDAIRAHRMESALVTLAMLTSLADD